MPRTLSPFKRLQAEVADQIDHGVGLDDIERELITPSQLPEDEKAAVWLLAWLKAPDGRD